MEIVEGRSFYDLYDDLSPVHVSFDVRNRVAAIFSRASTWEDEADWPESFDVQVDGGRSEFLPALAWSHACRLKDVPEYVACVSCRSIRIEGARSVSVNNRTASVWCLGSAKGLERYFRWMIVEKAKTADEMAELAGYAFEGIDFVPGVFDGIKKMSAPYSALVSQLVHHLGVLSDEGAWIFRGAWRDAPAQFASFGVQISDENGNTKSNAKAMKERTVPFNGKNLKFSWHIKLKPDRDRIHIFPDTVHSGKKIVVGIFCRHLTV